MQRRTLAGGIGLVALVILVGGLAFVQGRERDQPGRPDPDRSPDTSLAPVTPFSHAYLIVLENRSPSEILGSGDAPYIDSLVARYGSASDYHALLHPSQPNYLALFSGSLQGVADDEHHDLAGRTLADQLEAKGRTWRVFAENYPGGCFTGQTASGGVDGPGTYARKHNPAISFTSISSNPTRCANITDLSHFDPAAADFEMIVPNLCHDMHDCPVAEGDAWLKGFVPRILDSPAWRDGGVLFITFDEGEKKPQDGNRVLTVVVAPRVTPGFTSAVRYTHYSLLRTIQQAWDLGCLEESCEANDMVEFFGGRGSQDGLGGPSPTASP